MAADGTLNDVVKRKEVEQQVAVELERIAKISLPVEDRAGAIIAAADAGCMV